MGTLDLEWRFPKRGGSDGGDGGEPERAGSRSLLVLGDFGGRALRGLIEPGVSLAGRRFVRVRPEDFETAIAAVSPQLRLTAPWGNDGGGGGDRVPVTLSISSLEDFHPDALFKRLPFFRDPPSAPRSSARPPTDTADSGEDDAATVSRLLGAAPAAPRESTAVEALVGRIVASHSGATAPATASIDADAMGRAMRAVLRQPALQDLEAVWRALAILVSRLDEEIEVFLLDVSKAELAADLLTLGDDSLTSEAENSAAFAESGLGRRLLTPPGGLPFFALVGAFSFGSGAGDVALLRYLGALCARIGAPLVAGAAPQLLGCSSLAGQTDPARWPGLAADDLKRWTALRQSADACWLGLALPRFLARAPYGAKTGEIDAFPFEEIDGAPDESALVWGNSAFLSALALVVDEDSDPAGEIDDLPFFTFRAGGETEMYPASEVFWSDIAATAVMQRGLIPTLGRRDRNSARVVCLQSIADPPAPLGGLTADS